MKFNVSEIKVQRTKSLSVYECAKVIKLWKAAVEYAIGILICSSVCKPKTEHLT